MHCGFALAQKNIKDSVELKNVTVVGKSKTQKLREGALSVNAIDVRSMVNSLTNLTAWSTRLPV